MTMLLVALAAAALQAAPAPMVPAAPVARFTDLPNVTVTYYNVTGASLRELHASLDRQSRRDPATNKAVPATSEWSLKAAVNTSTTAGRCRITGVTLNFAGSARMPRLVQPADKPLDPALLAREQRYVAALEARQVAQLRLAYDRLPEVRRKIAASSCQGWKPVAAAAIDQVKREAALARARNPLPPPTL